MGAAARRTWFGRDKQHALRCCNGRLKPLDRCRRIVVVVLVVERQIADFQLNKREFCRRQARQRGGKLAIDGFLSQATDDDGDLILAHAHHFPVRIARALCAREHKARKYGENASTNTSGRYSPNMPVNPRQC